MQLQTRRLLCIDDRPQQDNAAYLGIDDFVVGFLEDGEQLVRYGRSFGIRQGRPHHPRDTRGQVHDLSWHSSGNLRRLWWIQIQLGCSLPRHKSTFVITYVASDQLRKSAPRPQPQPTAKGQTKPPQPSFLLFTASVGAWNLSLCTCQNHASVVKCLDAIPQLQASKLIPPGSLSATLSLPPPSVS